MTNQPEITASVPPGLVYGGHVQILVCVDDVIDAQWIANYLRCSLTDARRTLAWGVECGQLREIDDGQYLVLEGEATDD